MTRAAGGHAGSCPGRPGPGCFLVRALQVLVLGWLTRRERGLLARWFLLAAPVLVATGAILAASGQAPWAADEPGEPLPQILLITAIVVEYGADLLVRSIGFVVVSAGHWAERHALIVLVALGEAVLSLGVGPNLAAGLPLAWPVILGAVLGIAVIVALWWAYFDSLALALEQALHRTRDRRARMALSRDVYTYLHLSLVAGVILFALGLKRILLDVAESARPFGVPADRDALVLYGDALLYTTALAAMSIRVRHRVPLPYLVAVVALVGMSPLAVHLPGVVALAMLATVSVAMTVVQVLRPAPRRTEAREVALGEQRAVEAEQTEWRRRHL